MKKHFIIFLILIFVLGLVPVNFSFAITQNQISAEVQIVCTDGANNWFSGSGTIIDPKGIILTNKHVIEGAYKNTCIIGFVESISQGPNFGVEGNYNLAEVKYYTTTTDMDAAILYLDNPTNKNYPYINIWDSNSDNLKFGDKIEIIGYPSIGGSTITYSSGDFSGFGNSFDGTKNYIKTIAPIEHGNSGGAAYNQIGNFIGIPTFVIKGSLNSLGYILSVNSIKSWLKLILGIDYKNEVIEQKPTIEKPTEKIPEKITPIDINKVIIDFYDCSKFYTEKDVLGNLVAPGFSLPGRSQGISYFTDHNGKYINPSTDCTLIQYDMNKKYNIDIQTVYMVLHIKDESYSNILTWVDAISKETKIYQTLKSSYNIYGNIRGGWPQEGVVIKPDIGGEEGSYYYALQLIDKSGNASEIGVWQYNYFKDKIKNQPINIDKIFTEKVKGKILLQVESRGEAWYVNPKDGKRYYMANGNEAYRIMRYLGVGATNKDLEKIKTNKIFAKKNSGKIFLQIEAHGEAYYIDFNGNTHYLKDGNVAYTAMRDLGLGITNNDLSKIPEGSL